MAAQQKQHGTHTGKRLPAGGGVAAGCAQLPGFRAISGPRGAAGGRGHEEAALTDKDAPRPAGGGARQELQEMGLVVMSKMVVMVKTYPCLYCGSLKTTRTGQYRDKGIQYRVCGSCGKAYPVKLPASGTERIEE